MKNKYVVSIQFVNPNVYFDEEAKNAVNKAVSFYNTRSLLARNPKQITSFKFAADDYTLQVEFTSEEVLPTPSKALRLLSSCLVDTLDSRYLSGKQLFKMTTEIISNAQEEEPSEFSLLNTDEKLCRIYEILVEMRRDIS